jgi:hypothetical protein
MRGKINGEKNFLNLFHRGSLPYGGSVRGL